MAGQFLQGTTESMHHLANQVRANVDQMAGTKQAMNGHVEAMSAQWLGAGSNANQQGHSVWDGSTTSRVLHPGAQIGDNITTSANVYDSVDQSSMSRMAGIGQAINPTALA
jgi:uncharacterized protein YukE